MRIVDVFQLLSCVRLFAIPWSAAPVHHQLPELLKLMSIESVMPSNRIILCCPLLLPSIFPSIRVFFNELAPCIRWPEYWSFSFSIILGLHTGKRLMLPFSRQNSSVAHDSAIYMQLHLKLEQSLVTLSHTPGVSFNQFWAYQPDFKWPVPASHQKATLGLSRKSQSRGIWELFFCASPHPLSSF